MRVLVSVCGWMVKLYLGCLLASLLPLALSSGAMLLAFGMVNAIGLHVLLHVDADETGVPPPKPVLIGLGVAAVLAIGVTVASENVSNGCQTCLNNGNSWWYCFAIYGAYCL